MSTEESLHQSIEASCSRLEEIASSMGVTLSKSPASVPNLEEIILALLDIKADESTLKGATFMVGTYLGEILRAKLGGHWQNSAENELLLIVGETSYSPVAKVRKFSANPRGGDGLSFFANAALSRDV